MTTPVEGMEFSVDPAPPEANEAWLNGQDITDPVWPSEPVNPEVGHPFARHESEAVRTAHGLLDLGTAVKEEVEEWVERETEHGAGHTLRHKRDKGKLLDVKEQAAASWRANSYDIGKGNQDYSTKIVTGRDDRYRVLVTNVSAAILYLSHDSVSNAGASALPLPGMITLAVGSAPREFRTKGDIWAIPAVQGTSQIVDVQDEYGVPE